MKLEKFKLSSLPIEVKRTEDVIGIIRDAIFNSPKVYLPKIIIGTIGVARTYNVLNYSEFTRTIEVEKKDIEGIGENIYYTEQFLSLDFKGNPSIIKYTKSGLYVDDKMKNIYVTNEGKVLSVPTLREVKMTKEELKSLNRYTGFSWSNSEERDLRTTFIKDTGNAEDKFKLLDGIHKGSLSYALKELNFENNFKKVQKTGTRIGLHNAGSYPIGDIISDKYGVMILSQPFDGLFDFTEEEIKRLKDYEIDSDNQIFDGQHIKRASWLKEVLLEQNIIVELSTVVGIMEQERCPAIGNKSAGVYEGDVVFNCILERLLKSPHKIIGNPNNIVAIYDSNSAKIPNFDFKGVSTSNILEIAVPSEDAKTCNQVLSKVREEFAKDFMSRKYRDVLIDRLDKNACVQGSLFDIVCKVNPDMERDIATIKSLEGDLAKFSYAAIAKNKIKIEGSTLRAQFDNSFLINPEVNLLGVTKEGYIEAYSKTIINRNRKAIREIEKNKALSKEEKRLALNEIMMGVGIKFPSIGKCEYVLFRFLTDNEIKARTKGLKDEYIIKEYFLTKKEGIITLANINILKNKLAGMDTDFDSICVVTEKEFIDELIDMNEDYTIILNK